MCGGPFDKKYVWRPGSRDQACISPSAPCLPELKRTRGIIVEHVQRALEMLYNTAPFDITHHPAMAIPCGMSKGLPVSMQLVGKHYDEPTIYRAAHVFEQGAKWTTM
ncbi:MAG: amidase family protein [Alphaproteobacteria bacterium]|nr:amidase family protein [Alphaproteobacteria bacterium]